MEKEKISYYLCVILLTIIFTLFILQIIKRIKLLKFFTKDDVSNFTSDLDGKQYEIRLTKKIDINIEAVNYLSNLSNKIDKIVLYMSHYNLPNNIVSDRLYNRWRRCKLRETASQENVAAYTINKGDEIRLCIRKGENNDYLENTNTSMFVILHELAHLMSISYGHNDEFRENFSFIIHLSSELGIYKPQNFSIEPVEYCGININTTPCSQGTCKWNPESDQNQD